MNSLELMEARLGAKTQQERMIRDKRLSLDKAIQYSYQGAQIINIATNEKASALINPNTVKQDYDDKTISIGFEHNYTPGTIFEWVNGTKWLVYLQDLTELAYFHGDVRKCNYQISWQNKHGDIVSTFVALTGPKETNISSSTSGNISLDSPNHSLYLMMPNNSDTIEYFTRYSEFYLNNSKTCWKIVAVDDISMPGILEINAIEYYSNKDADDIERGLVDYKSIIPEGNSEIKGPAFIKPKRVYQYEVPEGTEGAWSWSSDSGAELPIVAKANGNVLELTWVKSYTGQFNLSFGSIVKTIVVESLF